VRTLNLGILAHVDAGKTSLTERLLHTAGAIDSIGRVDDGTTRTDTLALERQRGITIKSAVASFDLDDTTVNLIDTPGHPDFIAEVERVLNVLDGVVLVISAVEGVQAQTRVLMRTLRRLRIPTIIFLNKTDRRGAGPERVLQDIAGKLTPAIIPMGTAHGVRFTPYGPHDTAFATELADRLAANNDTLLAAYVDDEAALTYRRLRDELADQTRRALIHPVYLGSAVTGAGTDALIAGIRELLPATEDTAQDGGHDGGHDAEGPASGTVFKIERDPAGEKIAYVRMFTGTVRTRERLRYREDDEGKITAITTFDHGATTPRTSLTAGQIGTLRGLPDIRIGDTIGTPRTTPTDSHHFSPPTLETVITPRRAGDRGALHTALSQLTEQDPLINLRHDEIRQEIFVSLYGEVQKEVIQATLADEYGIDVTFRETTTICVERATGTGAAHEIIGKPTNPFRATVGLRIDPAPTGTGTTFRLGVELGSMPTAFFTAVEDAVRETLQQGLRGWQVTDCTVTMTHSGHKPPPSTPGDFRNLTPLLLMEALRQAGTTVYEPMHRFQLDAPADTLSAVLPLLARLRAVPRTTATQGTSYRLEGEIPAAHVHRLGQELPTLTSGEGVLEAAFDHYRPVTGTPPSRPRTDHNPLNRKEYLLHVVRRV
jgi:ribosomal protection tetracycline resistance protein